ncbi:hypothetical protein BKA56DRAFT_675013 [Ilyonectria sp. MPI-CAGE-AT-0026]|nr:hypothetical protein BKA56DRAFT_675013 [Ilyonectria sp. MPI-CAGE-AT-0026]
MITVSSSYAAIAALSATAYARNLALPDPTSAISLPQDGISPKPTAAPLGPHGLFLRASCSKFDGTMLVAPDKTCGYINGLSDSWMTCDSGYVCAFLITGKSYPYCIPLSYPGGFTDFICDTANISTTQPAYTTYLGETDSRSFETLSCSPTSAPHPSTTSPPPPSPTPVGAIVGGVIGGVAAISLAGLGLFFFLRNRKKRKDQDSKHAVPPPYPSTPSPGNQTSSFPLAVTDPSIRQTATSPSLSNARYMPPDQQSPQQHQGGFHLQQTAIYEAPSDTADQHRGQIQELS